MDELERELLKLREDERVTFSSFDNGNGVIITLTRADTHQYSSVGITREVLENASVSPLAFRLHRMRKDLDERNFGNPRLAVLHDGLRKANLMGKTIHIGVSVRGMLCQTDEELNRVLDSITRKHDGRRYESTSELRHDLVEALAEGIEYIPVGESCYNWDPKHGCLGHEKDTNDAE